MTSPTQEAFENFENLKFNPFESKDVLLGDSNNWIMFKQMGIVSKLQKIMFA